jgi:hypothetical protein
MPHPTRIIYHYQLWSLKATRKYLFSNLLGDNIYTTPSSTYNFLQKSLTIKTLVHKLVDSGQLVHTPARVWFAECIEPCAWQMVVWFVSNAVASGHKQALAVRALASSEPGRLETKALRFCACRIWWVFCIGWDRLALLFKKPNMQKLHWSGLSRLDAGYQSRP